MINKTNACISLIYPVATINTIAITTN